MNDILRSNGKMPRSIVHLQPTHTKVPKWLSEKADKISGPLDDAFFNLDDCCKPRKPSTPPLIPQRPEHVATPPRSGSTRLKLRRSLGRAPKPETAFHEEPCAPCCLDSKFAAADVQEAHGADDDLSLSAAADSLERAGLRRAEGKLGAAYKLGARLGEGGTASVFMATDAQGRIVAIKRVAVTSSARCDGNALSGALAVARREAAVLLRVRHPHVLALLSPVLDTPMLVLEHATGGDLLAHIARAAPGLGLGVHATSSVMRQCLSAIAHCHQQGVTHGDIKPENILLMGAPGNNVQIKLADFGSARHFRAVPHDEHAVEQLTQRIVPRCTHRHACGCHFGTEITGHGDSHSCSTPTECGTPQYWPPEMFDGSAQRSGSNAFATAAAADAWALGCVLFACLTTMHPFGGRPCAGNSAEKVRNALQSDAFSSRNDQKGIVDAMAQLLDVDPRSRVAVEQLSSEWSL
jgi:serine/threonine protein kinase